MSSYFPALILFIFRHKMPDLCKKASKRLAPIHFVHASRAGCSHVYYKMSCNTVTKLAAGSPFIRGCPFRSPHALSCGKSGSGFLVLLMLGRICNPTTMSICICNAGKAEAGSRKTESGLQNPDIQCCRIANPAEQIVS